MTSKDIEQKPGNGESLPPGFTDLIGRSINPNGKVAKRAQSELQDILQNQPNFDLTLTTINLLQRQITGPNSADRIKNAFSVIDSLVEKSTCLQGDESSATLQVTGNARTTVEKILEQDNLIQSKKHLAKQIQPGYTELIYRLVPQLHEGLIEKPSGTAIEYTPPKRSPKPKKYSAQSTGYTIQGMARNAQRGIKTSAYMEYLNEEDQQWQDFLIAVHAINEANFTLKTNQGEISDEPGRLDKITSVLKEQPLLSNRRHFYSAEINGVSLASIEQMPYPLSGYDAERITKFFISALKEDPNKDLLPDYVAHLIKIPLTLYDADAEPVPRENFYYLRNIEAWKMHFCYSILEDRDPEPTEQNLALWNLMPDQAKNVLMFQFGVMKHTSYDVLSDLERFNPFLQNALREHGRSLGKYVQAFFTSEEAVWEKAFDEKYFPQMVQRLKALGLYDQVKTYLHHRLGKELESPQMIQFTRLLDMYDYDFPHLVDETDKRADEIREDAIKVWQQTLEAGLQRLPLHDGVDIIHFSKRSVPRKMGVSKIYLNRSSDEDDWGVNVRFDFVPPKDSDVSRRLIGFIAHDGTLTLQMPLGDSHPGIEAVLHKLAVVTFKDLAYQHERDELLHGQSVKQQELAIETVTDANGDESDSSDKYTDIPRPTIQVRRQTEVMLEERIRPKIKQDPRKISVHKMDLAGKSRYENASNDFAMTRGIETTVLTTRNTNPGVILFSGIWHETNRDALHNARKSIWKPSEQKISVWPEGVVRNTIADPETDETVYLNTWVTEHTKPKLTPEQELEVILWQRHYQAVRSEGSALATMDEFRELLG